MAIRSDARHDPVEDEPHVLLPHPQVLGPRDGNEFMTLEASASGPRLGVVVGGSLSKGLLVKLDRDQRIEELAVGRYIVVHGANKRFFCMVTDISLNSTNPGIQSDPPEVYADPFLRAIYSGTAAYGTIHVQPMLSIDEEDSFKPKPVKTIPSHFMP